MKKVLFILFLLLNFSSIAQDYKQQRKDANANMREGNILYNTQQFSEAEVFYKKAVALDPGNDKAFFNLANAIQQQKRHKEALSQYIYLAKNTKNNMLKAKIFHNIGNTFMQQGDLEKAIAAYKESLRKNPKDEETRYNLALAQKLLKDQEKKNKDKKDNKKNDKKDNKDKKDKDKKDNKKNDKKDNKDKKDKDKDSEKQKKEEEKEKKKQESKDKKQDEKDKEKDDKKKQESGDKNQDKKEQQKQQVGKLSKEQMKQMLNALNNEEKKTQKKMNVKHAKKGKGQETEKDW